MVMAAKRKTTDNKPGIITSKESFEQLRKIEVLISHERDYFKKQSLRDNELRQAIRNLIPEIGMQCTICYYSDYRASTVTQVITDHKVAVRFNETKCLDYYGGEYEILPELEGGERIFTKRRNGLWIAEKHGSKDGVRLALHYQRHYIDPEF